MEAHLASISVDRNVRGTATLEGILEIPWAATNIEHPCALERVPRMYLLGRILSESTVKKIRLGLFLAECPPQSNGST